MVSLSGRRYLGRAEEAARLDGEDVALELVELGDGELRFHRPDTAGVLVVPPAEAAVGDHEGQLRHLELLPHVADEVRQVLFVLGDEAGVAAVVPPLRPAEAGDLVAAPVVGGEVPADVAEHFPDALHHPGVVLADLAA